jgi:spermidine/putrescine transport system permease protein
MLRHSLSPKSKKKFKGLSFEGMLGIPYYLLAGTLILLPILLMILFAFNQGDGGLFQIRFSFVNFERFFTDAIILGALFSSFYIAAVGTIITLIIAYPLALAVSKAKLRNKVLFISLITAPIWLNALLRINGLRQIAYMINPGLLGTDFILILGVVYMFLPFMFLPIFTVLSRIDKNLYESSADLGATSFQTIVKVIFPLSLSGVISGVMMVFLPAATTIIIPDRLGGGQARRLIGDMIVRAADEGIGTIGLGAAMSIVVGIILMIFIFLIRKTDRYGGQLDEKEF